MTRIHDVIRRYDACRAQIRGGVDIFAVGDPAGARMDAVTRRAIHQKNDEESEVWGDLLRAASAVRWRRITQPQPIAFNLALSDAVSAVLHEVDQLRGFVGDASLLDEIAAAAAAVAETDSPIGDELLRSIQEVGPQLCVVVASNGSARGGLRSWLEQFDVMVAVPGDLYALSSTVEQNYVVGPPTFFPASLLTAPAAEATTFVLPAWFGNRAIPASRLAPYAEGAIQIKARIYEFGDLAEPDSQVPDQSDLGDVYFPAPKWEGRSSEHRDPGIDEVEAWKVILGSRLALWLDDGERIRSFDPRQPEGARVSYEAVDDVRPGTYLVLREGATERVAMHDAALAVLGQRADGVSATQRHWKQALSYRLARDGAKLAIAELSARGLSSASRVCAWADPTLIMPKSQTDLAMLLQWLELPLEPYHSNALRLRRSLYKASAELRQALEEATAQADIDVLEREGFMRLELSGDGFRGMLVARVLARAPYTEIVPRHHTRVPYPNEDAQWLE